ncbi:MAG: ABC transporter substrate-binding protein [Alphaproteobacteria bacterium]|nr:ABC transporter substrate-binding protein [Alphaproteobacteria bacterium]MDE2112978.1 ABC transporter substrate-binding protein [Alphaproteobacteria bacterium]MDE2492313.1 ABC transporter substrate-binding protein [Alphaproteobacteria bacterium]
MSDVVSLSGAFKPQGAKLRIGLLRLTDAAPVIVAHEFGYFAEEGVDTELSVEPSWANIADKLAYGFLDAAVIVPPLAFAVDLGLRGAAQKLIVPYTISLGGNTVTLAKTLAQRIKERAAGTGMSVVQSLAQEIREQPMTLGIVHAYSTHNLLLRYWLATASIVAGRDVKLTVVPPARAVEALQSGQISGFCAGAPWGEVAVRAGAGATVATSHDIWKNAPEKAFAARARWADDHPEALHGALRALLRAAKFCDAPENASYTAALLSRRKYLDVDSHAILASLPGGAIAPDNVSMFFRDAATFPWRSQALWFLREMVRWDLLDRTADIRTLAAEVYRPDIYRAAVSGAGLSVPGTDSKIEGAHQTAWMLEAEPSPIAMAPDGFCDDALFDPDKLTDPALHNP